MGWETEGGGVTLHLHCPHCQRTRGPVAWEAEVVEYRPCRRCRKRRDRRGAPVKVMGRRGWWRRFVDLMRGW